MIKFCKCSQCGRFMTRVFEEATNIGTLHHFECSKCGTYETRYD